MKGNIMSKIGFAMALIGVAGLAEGQLISLLLIGAGALLMKGEYEKEDHKHPASDSNVLDRLHFLCK